MQWFNVIHTVEESLFYMALLMENIVISMFRGERDCPVFTTTVSQTGLQLSTSEERWQNDSGGMFYEVENKEV